ncbi:MAG: AlpA family phage regulatory protein [Planctomycetota bacterium]
MESVRLLNVRQVAAALGLSARQIYKLVAAGRFPAPIRLARSVRWSEAVIVRFVEAGCPSVEDFDAVAGTVRA